jgi:rhodanese-related sulfurtransferase
MMKRWWKQKRNYVSLGADEFQRVLERDPEAVLVDVRTFREYLQGHLPQAKSLNVQGASFDWDMLKLKSKYPAEPTVLVYCKNGLRSTWAAHRLTQLGFGRVVELQGGIVNGWPYRLES